MAHRRTAGRRRHGGGVRGHAPQRHASRGEGPLPRVGLSLLVRRSQTLGDTPLNTTKQKTRYTIDLPQEVLDVLRWHVDTQLVTPPQPESELLFPPVTGGYRSPTVLNKPFAEVSEAIGLGYAFTQSGMRRTFNDLARAAKVEALVTRSISGHLTERMQHPDSTVQPDEQRESIGRVISVFGTREIDHAGRDRMHQSGVFPTVGGAPGGASDPGGGAQKEKTG